MKEMWRDERLCCPRESKTNCLGSVDFLVSDSRNKLTRASYASCRTIFPP